MLELCLFFFEEEASEVGHDHCFVRQGTSILFIESEDFRSVVNHFGGFFFCLVSYPVVVCQFVLAKTWMMYVKLKK